MIYKFFNTDGWGYGRPPGKGTLGSAKHFTISYYLSIHGREQLKTYKFIMEIAL